MLPEIVKAFYFYDVTEKEVGVTYKRKNMSRNKNFLVSILFIPIRNMCLYLPIEYFSSAHEQINAAKGNSPRPEKFLT